MMELEKVPFRQYTLDKDKKEKRKVFSVSLNKKEQKMVKDLMIWFNVKSPGTAIKMGTIAGYNLLHRTFGGSLLRYLFKKDRTRLEDYEAIEKFKNEKL